MSVRVRATPRFPKWLDFVVAVAAVVAALRLGSLLGVLAIAAVMLLYGVLRDTEFNRK